MINTIDKIWDELEDSLNNYSNGFYISKSKEDSTEFKLFNIQKEHESLEYLTGFETLGSIICRKSEIIDINLELKKTKDKFKIASKTDMKNFKDTLEGKLILLK